MQCYINRRFFLRPMALYIVYATYISYKPKIKATVNGCFYFSFKLQNKPLGLRCRKCVTASALMQPCYRDGVGYAASATLSAPTCACACVASFSVINEISVSFIEMTIFPIRSVR